jgi:AcrR family transcriptional regulator
MVKRAKKRLRSADMKAEMIEVAEKIVSREGLSALTARRAAVDAGVAVGTIYNIFENLGGLVAEVNARTLADLAAALSDVQISERTTHDVLMGFADRYIAFVRDNSHRWMAVFEVEMPDAGEMLPSQAAIDQLFSFLEDAVCAHDNRIDARMARRSARGLWAAVHVLLILSASSRLPAIRLENVRPTIDHLVTCHLFGLDVLLETQKE